VFLLGAAQTPAYRNFRDQSPCTNIFLDCTNHRTNKSVLNWSQNTQHISKDKKQHISWIICASSYIRGDRDSSMRAVNPYLPCSGHMGVISHVHVRKTSWA